MISGLLKKVKDEGYTGLLILAFPTLGKTTLVKELNKGLYGVEYQGLAVDFDYKKGDKFAAVEDVRIMHSALFNELFANGIKVITCFSPWVDVSTIDREKVYIMGYLPESSRMAILREKLRGGVSDFMLALATNGDKWIASWKKQFIDNHVDYEVLKPYQYLSDWY